jgi:hypothetical protein
MATKDTRKINLNADIDALMYVFNEIKKRTQASDDAAAIAASNIVTANCVSNLEQPLGDVANK